MIKKTLYIVLFSFINLVICHGQVSLGNSKVEKPAFIQENIYVHYNTSFLVSGESFFYKIYCLNNQNNTLSDLSKIAYVELIGKNGKVIFKHKIKLESGLGQGDFFLPTEVPSGSYKLIAYTQWMKNFGVNHFFQTDIAIVNPFMNDQSGILENIDSTYVFNDKSKLKSFDPNLSKSNQFIEILLNKKVFKQRELVELKLNSINKLTTNGKYSVSVRKLENIKIPTRITALTFNQKKSTKNTIGFSSFSNNNVLPELRGELISGKVTSKESGAPAPNIKIGMSIPDQNFLFKISNTNNSGIFYFNLYENIDNATAIFQVFHEKKENFEIEIFKNESVNYKELIFNDFTITKDWHDVLINHSIYNQIENAYKSFKNDSISDVELIKPFYESKSEEFLLDDYTRFSTIRETIVELIPTVYSKNTKGNYSLHVRIYGQGEVTSSDLPLVIADGNLIQDQNDLVLYNPKNVKKISVVNEQYIYGGKLFKGIISIETFDGNYPHNISGDYVKKITLDRPQPLKKYYNQVYNKNTDYDHMPDYRSQLLWNPDLKLETDQAIIFYTSDNTGTYEVSLEGFTAKGLPISIKEIFEVVKSTK